ncbi:MSMEG_0570 family nitrogen starvation response protein [Salinisphaera sp. SPP-AMP-43]|uniref:MSMEG_0570 family nitrogen starvation response protein n=1 Tax=Salinisphaera sp. SPP-AMP-43 TaxID=3121288 RepID=UPI003C6DE616
MPETWFNVRWPDDSRMRCYSPSSTITQFFEPGARYAVSEFVGIARAALTHASERVRAKYGYACSASAEQLAVIERAAEAFASHATVTVEGFER